MHKDICSFFYFFSAYSSYEAHAIKACITEMVYVKSVSHKFKDFSRNSIMHSTIYIRL